jgi:putative tryptophan/tyrosine transport system substrate-binding protein
MERLAIDLFGAGKVMNKKLFWLFTLFLLAAGSFAHAQQPVKVAKIGWLGTRSVPRSNVSTPGRELFQREVRKLGYVEGKNIAFEYRSAENKLDRLPALADELIRLNVDVLVTGSTAATLAAKSATKTIPIVFLSRSDPVALGLVDSLARPEGNITGFTSIGSLLAGKRLELLKETIPKLSRVAVLWNPQNPASVQSWKESQLAARELGLELYSMEVKGSDKIENAFKEAIKARSAALAVTQSPFINAYLKQIADLATKSRLPTISPRGDFVDGGGLMSYGPDQVEAYRRLALMVDKILKGAKPGDLPVEQPTKFELVLNLKTAKQIGLTIPPNMRARADKVIK